MSEKKIILDLCGGTGAWSKPYKEAGYDVRVITYPEHDVRTYIPPANTYGILAAPPCTMFSIARNDKTAKSPRDLREGMEIVQACLNVVHECLYLNYRKSGTGLKFWAIENPSTGYLERFLGKAPFYFNPYDFGDPYRKRTALWGEFNFPKKNPVEHNGQNYVKYAADMNFIRAEKETLIPDGYQKKTGYNKRKIMRSITPQGFAKAFFEANE